MVVTRFIFQNLYRQLNHLHHLMVRKVLVNQLAQIGSSILSKPKKAHEKAAFIPTLMNHSICIHRSPPNINPSNNKPFAKRSTSPICEDRDQKNLRQSGAKVYSVVPPCLLHYSREILIQ